MSKQFAFVCTVFKNPSYLKGAITLAQSIRLTNDLTYVDIVCMITPDIEEYLLDKDNQIIKDKLYELFDKVIITQYLIVDYQTKNEVYSNWINASLTKWNCLTLVDYFKILYLDADQIVVRDLNHLFDIQTPAASFSINDKSRKFKNVIHYSKISSDHEKLIPYSKINSNSKLFIESTVLLTPSMDSYKKLIELSKNKSEFSGELPNEIDGYLLFKLYKQLSMPWTHISHSYTCIVWVKTWKLDPEDKIKIIKFIGKDKPWINENSDWIDVKLWYQIYNYAINNEFDNTLVSDKCLLCDSSDHQYFNIKNNKLIVSDCK